MMWVIHCLNLKVPKPEIVGFHGQTIFHNARGKNFYPIRRWKTSYQNLQKKL